MGGYRTRPCLKKKPKKQQKKKTNKTPKGLTYSHLQFYSGEMGELGDKIAPTFFPCVSKLTDISHSGLEKRKGPRGCPRAYILCPPLGILLTSPL